ncbi:MAG TPA: glycosyltransferase family 1 protein [Pyrinomonadaceae bacterium]|nr:glycosyltransferase family 1 protein [Pyrinomonadaceae bacterium]
MRIGIDGLPLTESLAGVGYYTLELAHHLSRDASGDEVEVVSPKPFLDSLRLCERNDSRLRFGTEKTNPVTARWWSIGLPRYLRRRRPDVFHGTNFEIPLRSVCPTVLTIHDLSLLLYPETHERRRVWRARRRLPLMARKATLIITVSEAVRQEVNRHLRIPLEKIKTVHSAAREFFRPMEPERAELIRTRLNIAGDFVLYTGTIEPRKNLSLLVRAFTEISRRRPGLQLVMAGKKGWLVEDFYNSLRQSSANKNVVFTGYLNDEELCALYSSCKVFVYPSLYEGFGFPPLEAMACGAPVIASRIPSIEEVAGTAALFVSPHSWIDLAESISRVLDNSSLREELITAGLERAKQYSWAMTAERTRAVYQEAMALYKKS